MLTIASAFWSRGFAASATMALPMSSVRAAPASLK